MACPVGKVFSGGQPLKCQASAVLQLTRQQNARGGSHAIVSLTAQTTFMAMLESTCPLST
jgi:hypothetical protein